MPVPAPAAAMHGAAPFSAVAGGMSKTSSQQTEVCLWTVDGCHPPLSTLVTAFTFAYLRVSAACVHCMCPLHVHSRLHQSRICDDGHHLC